MPIYEFRCKDCGLRFSQFYRHMHGSEEGLTPPCPNCQSDETSRVISTFAVQGPTSPGSQASAAQAAHDEQLASITPKEKIEKWRRGND